MNEKYLKQLKEFRSFMNACFEVFMCEGATDETRDIFYNSEFEITFRGKTVTLYNGADVFTGIEDLLTREIEENGEA